MTATKVRLVLLLMRVLVKTRVAAAQGYILES